MALPEGIYLGNNSTQECRNTRPQSTCYFVDTPIFVWSTPWTILGARLQPAIGPTVPIVFNSGAHGISGLFNSFFSAQLIWDLGNDLGVSYMLGGYTRGNDAVSISSGSLNQRFGLTYTGDDWTLSANAIWGINFDSVTSKPLLSPCPVSVAYPHNGCNPNFLNVDLTGTRKYGRWELGPVGLYSTDLNAPIAAYRKQSQFALGGLVGYYFDEVTVQVYVTRDVYENNYGGVHNTSGNLRITIPLGKGPPPPIPPAL